VFFGGKFFLVFFFLYRKWRLFFKNLLEASRAPHRSTHAEQFLLLFAKLVL
jgi:hypothetical protein